MRLHAVHVDVATAARRPPSRSAAELSGARVREFVTRAAGFTRTACTRARAQVVQFGTFLTFYFNVIDFSSPFEGGVLNRLAPITPLQWIWLVYGLVIGQGLNTAIYQAIGKAGVYYGYRLGVTVPWVTGFPFSVVPHPQYVGTCIFVTGVNIFCATEAHVRAGWFNLTAVQVLYYVYMALVEDYL